MKKLSLFLFVLLTTPIFSQSISVNTTTYTTEQLINQILINSPCVSGTNVNSKTGVIFGSTNGIGYFENSNSNFPFSSGVILTTGDANKTPSPNNSILSDGNAAWTGDSDLENNLLNQSGVSINSINATYIEFDFQPKTANFDFSFLFASEEYGTSQCDFSDAFAFLLKDVTTGSTNVNLAVIPGTNTPVSVETIRNNTYNSNCPSANSAYFGSFNGSGFGPAINFNGETVEMIASATGLNTNHIYRIKIVIADGGNNVGYDSAIFLKANSFNIGQNVLGLDYTQANDKAICADTPLPILSAMGLSPGTTFIWKKEDVDFSPAQTAMTLDLNVLAPLIESGIHNYSVTYTEPGCTEVTDAIRVEIYPKMEIMPTIPNLYMCDNGSISYDFDLNKNTTIILAGLNQAMTPSGILDDLPAGTLVTYHASNADAVLNNVPLSSPHTITMGENGKTIYIRIQNPITTCFEIKNFQLFIVPSPYNTNTINNLTLCARNITDTPPKAVFDFSAQKALILGTQDPAYNLISFHYTSSGAQNNTNSISLNTSDQVLLDSRTIYVRLQNCSNLDCYVTSSFQITVTPLPLVDILTDAYVCSAYTLPPLNAIGAQYWTGPNQTGVQLFPGNNITTLSTIYVFNQAGTCTTEDSFTVTIVNLSNITPITATYCTEYTLPTLPYAKYFTSSGGTNTIGNTELPAGYKIKTGGLNTFYVWFENTTEIPACQIEQVFEITIIPFTPLPNYKNQFSCTTFTLLPDPNGGTYYSGTNKGLPILTPGTVITVTTPIYVQKETGTSPLNCSSEKLFTVYISISSITPPTNIASCSSYKLPALAFGEYRTAAAGGGTIIPPGTLIDSTTTLWFYVQGQNCTDNLSFTITVDIPPLSTIPDTIPQCDVYYLPAISHTGDYYTGPLGTGVIRPVGYPITSTQTMYFYDKAATGSCYVQEEFLITINKSPLVDAKPVEVIECDQAYILDNLVNGEYYEFAGGPSPSNPILPSGYAITSSKTIYVYASALSPNNCISEYSISISVTYVDDIPDQYACDSFSLPTIIGQGDYYTAPDGPYGTGVKLTPPYLPITSTSTIYIYAEDTSRVSCSDEENFTITIYNTPVIDPIAPITRCESYIIPAYTTPINKYYTQTGGTTNPNTEIFPGDIISTSTTIYAYAASGNASTLLCTDEEPIVITITDMPKPILNAPPICYDFKTGVLTNSYISSGYTAPKYGFEWKKEDGTLVGSTADFSTNEPGNYTLTVTDLSIFGCTANPVPFTVIESAGPTSITLETSGWFTEEQTITVNAIPSIGDGSNFLYALDGNTPQSSPVFTNVTSGNHEIIIIDTNGCGATIPIAIDLINSPKFFTPNGDGYNDNWKIIGFPIQDNAVINIFNRYGKLLKQLHVNGNGWDGSYNGNPLPADDYWFSISYSENGTTKEYRSHFSLKR
jgi:gliding motility-associated-like protein